MVLTLEEVLRTKWKEFNPWEGVTMDQVSFYCIIKKEDCFVLHPIKFVRDSSTLKGRVIDFSVENGYDAKFGCSLIATGILDLKNDEPMEERWGYVDDYELLEDGNMPLIKLKNNG